MKSAIAAWAGVLVVAAALLAGSAYRSRDPDSTAYSEISGRMSSAPVRSWLAPDWGGSWGFTGPFREHPIGIFVLPALLGRAGYPPEQAAFAVGALFSIMSVVMVRHVAAPVARDYEARAAQWASLFLPIAFVYRIRANQEYPVLFFTLLALVATERTRRAPMWIFVLAAAACGLALVKGIFIVFIPIVCALWLLLIRGDAGTGPGADEGALKGTLKTSDRRRADAVAWIGLTLAMCAVAVAAYVYEQMYHRVTGESFMTFYLKNRIAENAGIGPAAAASTAAGASTSGVPSVASTVSAKLYNVVWYSARLLWFAVPGSLVLLASAPRFRRLRTDEARRVLFVALAAAAYVCAMSLGANKADRFIFPAYFLVGVAGAIVAMRRWTRVESWARKVAALPGYALPLAWLALFLLTFVTEGHLPYLKFWRR
jgi:hypothetical protein